MAEESNALSFGKLQNIVGGFLSTSPNTAKRTKSAKSINRTIKTLGSAKGNDSQIRASRELRDALIGYQSVIANPKATAADKAAADKRLNESMRTIQRNIAPQLADERAQATLPRTEKRDEAAEKRAKLQESLKKAEGRYLFTTDKDGNEIGGKIVKTQIGSDGKPRVTVEYPTGRVDLMLAEDKLKDVVERSSSSEKKKLAEIEARQKGAEPKTKTEQRAEAEEETLKERRTRLETERPAAAPQMTAPKPVSAPSTPAPIAAPSAAKIPSGGVSIPSAGSPAPSVGAAAPSATISVAAPAVATPAAATTISAAMPTAAAPAVAAQIEATQQEISRLVAALEQEKDLAGRQGAKLQTQLGDLRREISKLNQANPDPQFRKQYSGLTDLQRNLRESRDQAKTDPQAIPSFQSSLPAFRTGLALPPPTPTIVAAPAPIAGVTTAVPIPPVISEAPTPTAGAPTPTQGTAPVPEAFIGAPMPIPGAARPSSAGGFAIPSVMPRPTSGGTFTTAAGGQARTGPAPRPVSLNLRPSGAGSFSAGLALDAMRLGEGRNETNPLMGDTVLGDTTLDEGFQPSVLGDHTQTYAAAGEEVPPPTYGGGPSEPVSRALEMSRQQQMAKTSERFMGPSAAAEAAGGLGLGAGAAQGFRAQRPVSQIPGEPGGEEEGEIEAQEEEEEGDLAAQQQEAALQQQQAQQRAASQQRAAQATAEAKKQAKKKLLDMIKGSDVGLSVETIAVTLLINLLIWNVQGINKYIFKSELIPEQSFWEDVCCWGLDLYLCFGWLMSPCGILLILTGAAVYFLSNAPAGLTSLVK